MAGLSDARKPWDRLALELRAYGEAQRRAWGDIDDVQLARYLAGNATPEERSQVEQAMRDFADVREVVDVLRGIRSVDPEVEPRSADSGAGTRSWAERLSALPRSTVAMPQPKDSGAIRRRRFPWRAALIGVGLAASFVLGWFAGTERLFRPHESQKANAPEVLLAGLTAVPRDSRSVDATRVSVDDQGIYRIAGGNDFSLEIRSPRRGVATLVLVGPEKSLVYPRPGQADIAVEAMKPRKFGPLDRPAAKTTVLVIVTATPAADMIRRYLADGGAPDQIEQALWAASQRWAAVGRIIIEPPGRP